MEQCDHISVTAKVIFFLLFKNSYSFSYFNYFYPLSWITRCYGP